MMQETEQMREARQALQMLSASDPAASANMLRYVTAYALMLSGRRGRDRKGNEPQFGAGFVLMHGDERLCAAAARRSGTDYVYIAFDVDDASAPPVAAGVFHRQGDEMYAYGNCRLWSPADDGRAILVPTGPGEHIGYFAFQQGRPLKLVEAPLPGDAQAGFRRAETRMQRLLGSGVVRAVHGQGYLHVLQSRDGEIYADSFKAAA